MATFAELGIPFPLFEAPTTEASTYEGLATCRLCVEKDRHCFEINDLILPCPACGVEKGLSASDRGSESCESCGASVLFPEPLKAKKQLLVCYQCLRAGKAAIIKSTEFGLVACEHAVKSETGGVPGLETQQFERVLINPDEDWYGARVPSEHLWELLRTPSFHTWQDERWLFCCQRPMTYLGGWGRLVETIQPDDPKGFCEGLFDPADEVKDWIWESADAGNICLYAYRCNSCHRYRATWDSD